ncbi:hypothetical protein PV328_002786 [Microctonus aethiopoides]|uniref:Odorant receptor n=1 Tax=Microctonus aethiopoides TaxID=144406 RepID=A0AA39KJT1_9HYME|nr:hypothetical protein PV328_002786 [Microctonus aethiopoides]
MDLFNHPYYRASKNVTRLIGRWPYQKYWESRICSLITIFLSTSQFVAKILCVIVNSDDKEAIVESITPFMIDVVVGVKYANAVFNLKTVSFFANFKLNYFYVFLYENELAESQITKLLERLKEDWTIFTNEKEKRILNEYAYIGQLVVYGYIAVVYATLTMFLTEPLMPKWINFILQLNETVPNKFPVPIYWYKVDMEKNFYPILCYESICITIIMTITAANDSMFIVLLQHACALFAVVGRQLENLPSKKDLEDNWNHNKESRKTDDIQYDHYIICIKNHKRAIEFAKLLEDMYVWCFGVVIAINLPIMSITAVQMTTQSNTVQQTMKYVMFAGAQVMHLFFDCYLSQRLADNSSTIEHHIIHSEWYKMTLKTQKLVTLVTLRSQDACRLTAGKLVLLSMETFGVVRLC